MGKGGGWDRRYEGFKGVGYFIKVWYNFCLEVFLEIRGIRIYFLFLRCIEYEKIIRYF